MGGVISLIGCVGMVLSCPMSGRNKPKYKKFDVSLPTGELTLYAGNAVLEALTEVTTDMNLWKGVKLQQVLKAVYEQGLKDGRREIIEGFNGIAQKTNYMPPGRPRKK